MADPMGEANTSALHLHFDRRLMLQFRNSTITSDAGLLAYCELDDTLQLTDVGSKFIKTTSRGGVSSTSCLEQRLTQPSMGHRSHRQNIGKGIFKRPILGRQFRRHDPPR